MPDALPSELILFISDASAEAERLAAALRAQRYIVIDVPLSLLAHRVTVQQPALVLCDADAEGAVDVLRKMSAVTVDAPVPVVLLGLRGGTMDRIDAGMVAAAFARPVNVRELTDTIERLVGTPATGPKSMPPSRRLGASSHPPKSARPDGAAAVPLPPDLAGDPIPRDNGEADAIELAPEIKATLADAERRWDESRPAPSSGREEPGPEMDIEIALPADVLAALDEPLDEEEAEEEHGHRTASGGTAHGGRTGARGGTQAGNTGTTGAGTTGLERRDSRLPPRPATPTEPPRSVPASEPEEAREARQQASTPKPPRPGGEDTRATGVGEPREAGRRPTLPPATVADPAAMFVSRPVAPPGALDPASRSGGAPTTRMDGLEQAPPRELGSTTPPLGNREGASRPPEVPRDGPAPPARPSAPPASGPSPPTRADVGPAGDGLMIPAVLRAGDAVAIVARAIRHRFTGGLRFEVDEGIRRLVFRDGDFVTAASAVHGESLIVFLGSRGDLPAEVVKQAHKLPAFGRRAGAALIAQGHLSQDVLWPVLRAHAEWLIGRVLGIERGSAAIETPIIDRLRDEPAVFGGATGAEVFVEVLRRVVPEDEALSRLGGAAGVLEMGPSRALLEECALPPLEAERVLQSNGHTVGETVQGAADPSFTSALSGLVALSVLGVRTPEVRVKDAPAQPADSIDEDARRERILTRKALVDEGDYFALLGVSPDATGYDIKRAYTTLRRDFEPSRALTTGTADLAEVVEEIVEVLDEAYEVLGDQRRRERYRRAIAAVP